MKSPEQWAEEFWRAHPHNPDYFHIEDLLREALAGRDAELDLLRRHLWDACQEDPRRQVAAGAALARGQVAGWLRGKCRDFAAEARGAPDRDSRDEAEVQELLLESALAYVEGFDGAPCVPLPPCELEARVRAVLAWADGRRAEYSSGNAQANMAFRLALIEACARLREALGE